MNPLVVGVGTLLGAGAIMALLPKKAHAGTPTSYALPRPGYEQHVPGWTYAPPTQDSAPRGCTPPPPLPSQYTGDLSTLHPQFRSKVEQMLIRLESRGFRPRVHTAWRNHAYQQQLLRQGKTRTDFSLHNVRDECGHPKSLAVDVIDRRWAWSDTAAERGFWRALREEARAVGLHAPFDWDPAHVQAYSQGQNMIAKLRGGGAPSNVTFAGADYAPMGGYEIVPAYAGC